MLFFLIVILCGSGGAVAVVAVRHMVAPSPSRTLLAVTVAEASVSAEAVQPEAPPPHGPDELSGEELAVLEAIHESMEKSAHVLKTIVALCVERGIFTKEEMARRRRDG